MNRHDNEEIRCAFKDRPVSQQLNELDADLHHLEKRVKMDVAPAIKEVRILAERNRNKIKVLQYVERQRDYPLLPVVLAIACGPIALVLWIFYALAK